LVIKKIDKKNTDESSPPPLYLCSVIPLLNRSSKKSSRLTSIASGKAKALQPHLRRAAEPANCRRTSD